ncbi:hypothetical protein Psta_4742 [Pirellula staleyi DSM 6068]|uniref:Uncharacterized protein n=1 Tax=Pirellula staleyi (strain ATCC 27377 / DSM 6068 / ICPB 4128) TaxID=530564 RepID=D2R852_PIRSD|nr:hypothetical protein Psta_4742 [Pirellula staleyi DSM 6068]
MGRLVIGQGGSGLGCLSKLARINLLAVAPRSVLPEGPLP